MKFVIFVNIDTEAQNAPGGPDLAHIFRWDLRRHKGSENDGGDVLEHSGPSLASERADSVANARAAAEIYASFYAQEVAYVYEVGA